MLINTTALKLASEGQNSHPSSYKNVNKKKINKHFSKRTQQ